MDEEKRLTSEGNAVQLRKSSIYKWNRLLIILGGSANLALLAFIIWIFCQLQAANCNVKILSANLKGVTEKLSQLETVVQDYVHLIGDPSVFNQYFNKESADPLTLRRSQGFLIDGSCKNQISNNYAIYCQDLNLFCTTTQDVSNGTFLYFTNWSGNSSSNYNILPGGKIQVKTSGKYKILADVHWKTENDILLRLFSVDAQGTMRIINDDCKKDRDPEKKQPTEEKCAISTIELLHKNDIIYLGFKGNSPFYVQKGSPSFHVIKVDDKIF